MLLQIINSDTVPLSNMPNEHLKNKETKAITSTSKKQSSLASKINWGQYSTFFTLARHVKKSGTLIRESFSFPTAIELASSRTLLLQEMQQESFPQEFKALSSGISVHSSSKIASLYPIFHSGLVKVGGRIHHGNIPEESKHQVILSKYNHGTQAILRNINENNLHVDQEHTLETSGLHYWIPSCRGLIKNIPRDCVK